MEGSSVALNSASTGGAIRRAIVVALDEPRDRALLRWTASPQEPAKWASCGVWGEGLLRPGDQVAAAETEEGDRCVLALLGRSASPSKLRRVSARDGASAEVDEYANTLRLRAPSGELILEYDATSGRVRLQAPAGDLVFEAPHGGIAFRSERAVRIESAEAVHVGVLQAGLPTGVDVTRDLVQIRAPAAILEAQRAHALLGTARVQGESLSARFERMRLVVETMESFAGSVIARSKDFQQMVTGVWRLTSERLRATVRSSCQLRGRRVLFRAEEDVKVKGKRIDLG